MIIVYGCLELWTPQKFIFDNIPKYAIKKKNRNPNTTCGKIFYIDKKFQKLNVRVKLLS